MPNASSVKLIDGSDGLDISFNGRPLCCNKKETNIRLKDLSIKSKTLYIVFSPLLINGIKEIEDRITSDSQLLLLEGNRELFDISQNYFKKLSLNKTKFFLLESVDFKELMNEYVLLKIRRVEHIRLNRGYMINRRLYESFFKKIESFIQQFWKNKITFIHMGRLWFKNIFLNLPELRNSYPIENLKTNKPIIVCGAGESLEASIRFLKDYRKYFFLTAVDTAVCSLLENNIQPDLIIVLEAQHANIYDFYHKNAFSIPAAFDLSSSPQILRKFTGPKYFFISDFYQNNFFEELKNFKALPYKIPPLGSVGIVAVYLSVNITNSNIFYTGMDFSFIPEKYHAASSPTHKMILSKTNRFNSMGFFPTAWTEKRTRTKDKTGRRVYTDLVMSSYSTILQSFIGNNNRVFNIGKFGLKTGNSISKDALLKKLLNSETVELSNNKDNIIGSNTENLIKLLKNQISIIDKAESLVIAYLNNSERDDESEKEMLQTLIEIDYTWLYFPDVGYLPEKSESFLKRFLYSSAWFKKIIKNSLSLMD